MVEKDKRIFYTWVMVLFANITVIIAMSLFVIHEFIRWQSVRFDDIWSMVVLGFLGLSIFLCVSALPVKIAQSSYEWKNHFGYGVPVLLLILFARSVYDYYTCTGKFCQIGPVIFGWIDGISVITFILFYTIGIYSRKWDVRFFIFLVWAELILLVSSIIYLTVHLFK